MKTGYFIKSTVTYIYTVSALMLILGSCARPISPGSDVDNVIVYPPPPDLPRIQFLTTFSTSSDIHGDQSGFNRFVFGEEQPKTIVKPYGICTSKNKIYIADAGIGGLVIIDLEEKSFRYFVPGGMGVMKTPINCFIDEDGILYVADAGRRQVLVYNSEGKYLDAFGETGNFKPTGLWVSGDNIFVTNIEGGKICVYRKNDHTLNYSFPGVQEGNEGYLYQPVNICMRHDIVYVTDFGEFRIKKYSTEGKYLGSVGSYGRDFGQFIRPKGLCVDRDSNLYVVDAAFENAQVFNPEGDLLMYFGGSYEGPGRMNLPAGIAIDYDLLEYFRPLVFEHFKLQYLIFVANQLGPDKINVYGFIKQN